ncbi:MAG: two-component regulator propeller domain-containing protein [Adhaeribacter sp.]
MAFSPRLVRFFLFFFCCLVAGAAGAQQIQFRNYTVSEGLSSNTVWTIAQDQQGYMWFGTKEGLTRFDGYQYKSFRFDKRNPASLGNNFIRKIFRFDDKTFWIGTEEGIYLLDLQKETFKLFAGLGRVFVHDIHRDQDGMIWIATNDRGLYRYQPQTRKISQFKPDKNTPGTLSAFMVRSLASDPAGNLWIGTVQGLDKLERGGSRFRHYQASGKPGSLSANNILKVYSDLEGQLWVGTVAGGLNRYHADTDSFSHYMKGGPNTINDNIVRSLHQPRPGLLYIGTEKGLNVLDLKSQQFRAYSNKNNDPYSISDDAVYSIFEDREGGIWLGTYFGGVNYFHRQGSPFELFYPTGEKNSLAGNAVSAFLQDDPTHLWIGMEDGGLTYFNTQTKTFRNYPFEARQDKLSYHNIHALYKDKSGNIWIGTYTGGLNIFNPRTGKIRKYAHDPADPNTLSNNTIYAIYEDKAGAIWVGTVSGLNRYNPGQDNFTRIRDMKLGQSCIYDLYEDGAGLLWVATYNNGLIVQDKKTGRWSQFTATGKPYALSTNKVITIFRDHRNNIWLGTDGGGLNLFDRKTNTFRVFDEEQGITSSVIYGILEDKRGHLWLSTNNGLIDFDPKTLKSKGYSKFDNLQSQQFNYKAYLKAADGKFYFGGINGFNAFNPDSLKNIPSRNAISFTNLQLFNKDVTLQTENSPLSKTINHTRQITLGPDQSVVSLEYAALSFLAPRKIRYAYKMEGFDTEWNYVGRQKKATYTNLPAGDYVFKVKATDNNGSWNTRPATLRVKVLPPFYQTPLAYTLYVLLFAGGLVAFREISLRQARKRHQIKMERQKNKKEREFYKQKIDFFTAMAHEVRTPLSLITAPLEKLINSGQGGEEVQQQLAIMEENGNRLLNLVNQLLDFRRIETKLYEIHTESVELVSLVQSLHSRFSAISYQKGFRFDLHNSLQQLQVEADPEALTKILSNLLINAFKFTRTHVTLSLQGPVREASGQEYFSISVEDDGIGIPKAQLGHIFRKFFTITSGKHQYSNLGGTGIGLALAKALSEKHGGRLQVESIEGSKTIFTVFIPFKPCAKASQAPELVPELPRENPDLEEEKQGTENDKPAILLVEDDISLQQFIYQGLEAEGYRVVSAGNGVEALKLLETETIDLVLSDVMMPEMDGMELCRQVKTNIDYSHMPLVLLTAKANSEAEIEGLESGADFYIPKPFKWRHVLVVIKNLLDSRSRLKVKFSQQPFADTTTLTSNSRDKKFLEKVVQIIESRLMDPKLSVEELGRELAMSRSSLHKKLKAMTGQVPNEFIRLVRLKKAANLLVLKEYNVSEIGYMVGFNSHSYFSKCFFQQFNLTPSEFAEKHQAEHLTV